MFRALCFVSLVATSTTAAMAASVSVQLAPLGTDGEWELLLCTSVGDNDGIAGYTIAVENATSLEHLLIGQGIEGFPDPIYATGFTIIESTSDSVFGGQNSTNPESLIYGVGNPSFSVPEPLPGLTNFNMGPVGTTFGPVRIARLTRTLPGMPEIETANVNVWDPGASDVNGTSAQAADVEIVPYLFGSTFCDRSPADFDKDGDVDGDDFLIWQAAFPTLDGSASSNTGDANRDGNVDGEDFIIWQEAYGMTSGHGGSAPEPAAVVIALLLALLVNRRGLTR